jgi:hypothetical protein
MTALAPVTAHITMSHLIWRNALDQKCLSIAIPFQLNLNLNFWYVTAQLPIFKPPSASDTVLSQKSRMEFGIGWTDGSAGART